MKRYLVPFILALLPISGNATTILLYDDFSSSGNLSGKAPTISNLGAVTWLASTTSPALNSNGSVLLANTSAARRASLDLGANYLISNPNTYTLSLEVQFPETTTGAWMALGFTEQHSDNANFNQNNATGGSPWLFLRDNGALQVYGGVALTNTRLTLPAGTYPGGTAYTLELVLNTESPNWTLDAFINGAQLDLNGVNEGSTYTFSTNPTIRYIGFSTSGTSGGPTAELDNFQFTVVPEPRTLSFLVLGLASLIFSRRKSRRIPA